MNSEKMKNVVEFYYENVRGLKETERQGWIDWSVSGRRESIPEHCWSAQILAFAIWSEFDLDLDIYKVMLMLPFHETEEIKIGDNTPFGSMTPEEKLQRGHKAVRDICSRLSKGKIIIDLINEFDAKETPEAQYAYMCDKMDCDLMAKLFSDLDRVSMENMPEGVKKNAQIKQIMESKPETVAELWLEYDRPKYQSSSIFTELLDFVLKHQVQK